MSVKSGWSASVVVFAVCVTFLLWVLIILMNPLIGVVEREESRTLLFRLVSGGVGGWGSRGEAKQKAFIYPKLTLFDCTEKLRDELQVSLW